MVEKEAEKYPKNETNAPAADIQDTVLGHLPESLLLLALATTDDRQRNGTRHSPSIRQMPEPPIDPTEGIAARFLASV